ncbi:MAG: SusC/RagA family protein, partial [Paludibacter sp.]|nr:SusC/RagA family protein [Paludibacter sp.]
AIRLFQISDFDKDANGNYTLKSTFPTQTFSKVRPGDIMYSDINGDGKITTDDETYLGPPAMPEIVYGIMGGLNYETKLGTFDFNFLIQGTGISNVMLGKEVSSPFYQSNSNVAAVAMDWWSTDNPNAKYPVIFPGGGTLNNQQNSDFWLRSNAYVRLKNIELGYTLPKVAIQFLAIKSMRLFYSGQNLFTYAPGLQGLMDPEMGADGVNSRGWVVPQQRVHSVGLTVNF